MTIEEVKALTGAGGLPPGFDNPELVETHISWVIIGDEYVYKIKKPVHYSFLDFSTLESRRFYCDREVDLNKRFTHDIYLGVVTVRKEKDRLVVDSATGIVIDYAVKMRKLDRNRQMDKLIRENKVSDNDIRVLAEKIASFHQQATIVSTIDLGEIRRKFDDLQGQVPFLTTFFPDSDGLIAGAMLISGDFLEKNNAVFEQRVLAGFFRDCHGDLHTRNIFLLPQPVPFDCLEFNDELRYMDVLDEVAFLCMDLDALDRHDLSELFILHYDRLFRVIRCADDRKIFIYYKAYRANIRAKVNSLRAAGFETQKEKKMALQEAFRYLQLMNGYMQLLKE